MKISKEKSLAEKEYIRKQKEFDRLTIEKKTEIKKQLADFRLVRQFILCYLSSISCSHSHLFLSPHRN
jgi:hypothetical protein